MLSCNHSKSRTISFASVFAAMIVILDIIPIPPGFYSGIWDSWAFLLSPLIGVLLGPFLGAFSVGLGTLVGHIIYFRGPYELVFMLGAPVGALVSGFIYKGKWRPVFGLYTILLVAYFITPVVWGLPLWGIWDILVGYAFVFIGSLLEFRNAWPKTENWATSSKLFFSALIGLETDILVRVFIFIPGQTYWLFYGLVPSQLEMLWLVAGFITPIKVIISTIICISLGLVLNRQLKLAKDPTT